MAKGAGLAKVFNFLREQVRRSAVTNTKVISDISTAVTNKDVIGAGKAVTGSLTSAVKEVGREMAAVKSELVADFAVQQPARTYLDSMPPRIRDWAQFYQPKSHEEQTLFDGMKQALENGGKLQEQLPVIAQLGDTRMMEYLYEYYPKARPYVVENPECPKFILEKAVKDPNAAVRQAAFSRSAGVEAALENIAKETMKKTAAHVLTHGTAPKDLGCGR